MNFDFSDAQKALKKQTRDLLRQVCDLTVPRRVLEGEEPYADEVWKALVDMESPGIAIPEQYGGLGFGYLELCVVAEELGRSLAPTPFSSSVYLATEAILLAGTDEQKQQYLPKLAKGEIVGTFALSEGSGALSEEKLACAFADGALRGAKTPVPDGDVADFAVVVARDGDADGASLALVDLTADGVERTTVATLDPTRSHARVAFDGAAAQRLGAAGEGWKLKDRVFDRAAVLFAMEQLGGSDACLAMATDYAKGRYAFGRPIGSFQAIKHKLADMYIKNELARANDYYGAWALSTDADELALAAAAARVASTEAYHYAAKENIQTHGGIGFTWESDCHLFYRRSKLLSLNLGSARVWKDRLVTALEAQHAA
ncbi:MAG: acyl-CoA dehydrogenase [Acidobacteria bacterium]|nr:MAG: acyl-CoA dehydrogenase [Acidobacteriota bacterium]REK04234.1 MAG: acyl-CoA dehydrogenase [Acidobacteriota bacterium]